MSANFDFNQVGKKMPYEVPEGFFDELEVSLTASIPKKTKRKSVWLNITKISVAAAASVALLLAVKPLFTHSNSVNDSFAPVQAAFNNLSEDDQAFYLEIYEDDIFMNEDYSNEINEL